MSNQKIAAVALAAGGKLARVVEELGGGRLVFEISGLPADWLTQLTNDTVMVSGRAMLEGWERVLGLIEQHRRDRARR